MVGYLQFNAKAVQLQLQLQLIMQSADTAVLTLYSAVLLATAVITGMYMYSCIALQLYVSTTVHITCDAHARKQETAKSKSCTTTAL